VKDGVLLGVHFLLYPGTPEQVHSSFGVFVCDVEVLSPRENESKDGGGGGGGGGGSGGGGGGELSSHGTWTHYRALSRLLRDVNKDLIICTVTNTVVELVMR
jgi:tRNA splicing endonuclease